MTIPESFEMMVGLFKPSAAGNMNKTLQWDITGPQAGKYALKIANGQCELISGGVDKADMTLTVADEDWLAIAAGADAMKAFASGKIKLKGDMMLAMKVHTMFPFKG